MNDFYCKHYSVSCLKFSLSSFFLKHTHLLRGLERGRDIQDCRLSDYYVLDFRSLYSHILNFRVLDFGLLGLDLSESNLLKLGSLDSCLLNSGLLDFLLLNPGLIKL